MLTRPGGVGAIGALTVLVGAWGAVVAFVGPLFGYNADGLHAWSWTTNHWLLHLVPGAVAVLAGLMVLSRAAGRRATTRSPFGLAGLLTVAAGAWFVLGPALWPVFESGPVFGSAGSHVTAFVNAAGSSLAPGLLLAVFGGMALKAVTRDREVTVTAEVPPRHGVGPSGGDGTVEGAPA